MENGEKNVLLTLTPSQAHTVLVALEGWRDNVEGDWTELESLHPFLAIGKEKELENCDAIVSEIDRQLRVDVSENG